jgi:hypothetical protein
LSDWNAAASAAAPGGAPPAAGAGAALIAGPGRGRGRAAGRAPRGAVRRGSADRAWQLPQAAGLGERGSSWAPRAPRARRGGAGAALGAPAAPHSAAPGGRQDPRRRGFDRGAAPAVGFRARSFEPLGGGAGKGAGRDLGPRAAGMGRGGERVLAGRRCWSESAVAGASGARSAARRRLHPLARGEGAEAAQRGPPPPSKSHTRPARAAPPHPRWRRKQAGRGRRPGGALGWARPGGLPQRGAPRARGTPAACPGGRVAEACTCCPLPGLQAARTEPPIKPPIKRLRGVVNKA